MVTLSSHCNAHRALLHVHCTVLLQRIEADFKDRSALNALHCCKHCYTVYPGAAATAMHCSSAPTTVSFRGTAAQLHAPADKWSLTAMVTALHARGMSWTDVHWYLWGLSRVLQCSVCCAVFCAGEVRMPSIELLFVELVHFLRLQCSDGLAVAVAVPA
jgi:hypothetical protein